MKVREPLYWGKKASQKKAYYLEQLSGWSAAGKDVSSLSDFYVIKNPANPRNLMDIIRISHWHGISSREEDAQADLTVIGIAANKSEAEDLAVSILQACYQQQGVLDRTHLFPEGQVPSCISS